MEDVIDYRGKTPPKSDSGFLLISAANIKNGKLDFAKASYISPDDYAKWTVRGLTRPGDVLITTEAPAGEVAPYPKSGTYQISRRVMALRADETRLHHGFLLYALQSRRVQQELLGRNRGTTVPRVLKPDILGLKVPLPTVDEQRRIAAVLGALDDKIELNRRMNETLEGMARALFKSWFVDFDPVRAKMEGRAPYGMDADTAALFPDHFEDSKLGQIPAGWTILSLREACEVTHGFAFKGAYFSEHATRFQLATPRNFAVGGGFRLGKPKFYDGPVPDEFVFRGGELIVTMTDLSKTGDTLGFPAVVPEQLPFVLLHNQRIGLVSVDHNVTTKDIVYWIMRSRDYRTEVLGSASGSTVRHTSPKRILAHRVALPPRNLQAALSHMLESLRHRVECSSAEVRSLGKLRDTLLPKLLSGKIRVPEGEELVEGA